LTEPAPPHDLEAEEQLLGAILTGGAELLERVQAHGITAGSFWRDSNRVVFTAAVDVARSGETVDSLTVTRGLQRTERIHEAGGFPRVQSLPSTVTAIANWPTRANLVLEAARRRDMLTIGRRITAAALNGGLDQAAALELARQVEGHGAGSSVRLASVDRLDVRSLLAAPPPPIRWAWQGYIESGTLTVLHGDGGLGKSQLALGLARATVQGGHFLHRPTRQSRVMIVDGENGLDEIARRLHGWDFTEHADSIDYLRADAPVLDPSDMSGLRQEIRTSAIGLAILDGQRALWPGDEREALEVVRLYQALYHEVAEPTGAAVLLLHHDNKGGGYSGSTAINGGVASRLHLEAGADWPTVKLVHAKARGSARMPTLDYRLEFDAGRWLTRILSIAGASDNPAVMQAAMFVHERGAASTREIADHVDKDDRSVRRWVKDGVLAVLGIVSEGGHHRPAGVQDEADTDMPDTAVCPPLFTSNHAGLPGGHAHTADMPNVHVSSGSVDTELAGGHALPPTGGVASAPDVQATDSPDDSPGADSAAEDGAAPVVVSAGLPDRPSADSEGRP
jgi:hypothetical protein